MTTVRTVDIAINLLDNATAKLANINNLLRQVQAHSMINIGATSGTLGKIGSDASSAASSVNRASEAMNGSFKRVNAAAAGAAGSMRNFNQESKKVSNSLLLVATAFDTAGIYQIGNKFYSASLASQALGRSGVSLRDTWSSLKNTKVSEYTDSLSSKLFRMGANQQVATAGGRLLASTFYRAAGAVGSFGTGALGGMSALAALGTVAAVVTTVLAGLALVIHAMPWQSMMAQVGKTTELTGAALNEVSYALLRAGQSSGIATNELAQVAIIAGQVGMSSKNDIMNFTKAVSTAAIAWNMTGEAAGTAIAKISNIYTIKPDHINDLTSAITTLANDTAATEREILDFMMTLGNSMKMFGATSAEAAALGATLTSLGIDASRAGTEVNSAIVFMMRAENIGKIGKLIGRSTEEVANQDITKTIIELGAAIEKLEPVKRSEVLLDVGGMIGTKALRPFTDSSTRNELSRNVLNSLAASYLGNATEEAAQRKKDTGAAELQNTKNIFNNMFTSLGMALLPTFTALLKIFNAVAKVISAVVVGFAKLFEHIDVLSGPLGMLGTVLNFLAELFTRVIDVIVFIISKLGFAVEGMDWDSAIRGMSDFFKSIIDKIDWVLELVGAEPVSKERAFAKAAKENPVLADYWMKEFGGGIDPFSVQASMPKPIEFIDAGKQALEKEAELHGEDAAKKMSESEWFRSVFEKKAGSGSGSYPGGGSGGSVPSWVNPEPALTYKKPFRDDMIYPRNSLGEIAVARIDENGFFQNLGKFAEDTAKHMKKNNDQNDLLSKFIQEILKLIKRITDFFTDLSRHISNIKECILNLPAKIAELLSNILTELLGALPDWLQEALGVTDINNRNPAVNEPNIYPQQQFTPGAGATYNNYPGNVVGTPPVVPPITPPVAPDITASNGFGFTPFILPTAHTGAMIGSEGPLIGLNGEEVLNPADVKSGPGIISNAIQALQGASNVSTANNNNITVNVNNPVVRSESDIDNIVKRVRQEMRDVIEEQNIRSERQFLN